MSTAALSLGIFRIGRMRLAVPSERVERILRGPIEVGPFPQAPRHVLGALALSGRAIPILDLAALVRPEIEPEPARPVGYALILRSAGMRLAVQVDEILAVVQAAPDSLTKLGGIQRRSFKSYTPPLRTGKPPRCSTWIASSPARASAAL